mmetsp:Transcript_25761/g.29446  ORF Transcript_25761/g.29446 Transcript_25761/m.29446 type:complete len:194 (+) Transcript_25761:134-715(+)|eukprot:CAMPEP_0194129988 /NCGR_PEP_ID=MMETSP0152-20130528/1164_1 /TAXON_ID=1049557 /ORGANISM="Thalassiothrix antarctica, Strain L6-D1" /LENGTH=193 /DNA_ID=CAMNT_0038824391 /DNA_START=129 /DNA_END=710 /DNA_ORIENTATION=+
MTMSDHNQSTATQYDARGRSSSSNAMNSRRVKLSLTKPLSLPMKPIQKSIHHYWNEDEYYSEDEITPLPINYLQHHDDGNISIQTASSDDIFLGIPTNNCTNPHYFSPSPMHYATKNIADAEELNNDYPSSFYGIPNAPFTPQDAVFSLHYNSDGKIPLSPRRISDYEQQEEDRFWRTPLSTCCRLPSLDDDA